MFQIKAEPSTEDVDEKEINGIVMNSVNPKIERGVRIVRLKSSNSL